MVNVIKDNRIDLTLRNEFRNSFECNDLEGEKINSFRITEKRSLICEAGYSKIPWRYHEFGRSTYMNVNNDYLSGEFGADIYFTSDNHYFVTDDESPYSYQRKSDHLNAIMEEFFIETLGYIPNSLVKYCYRCGRRFFDYGRNIECEDCRADWEYEKVRRLVSNHSSRESAVPW